MPAHDRHALLKHPWTTVLSALVLPYVLSRLCWLAYGGALCRGAPFGKDLLRPGACIEFWLNRYQTLFGVLAAVAAAWLAWRAAEKNVAVVDAGLAVSRRQLAFTAIDPLSARLHTLEKLSRSLIVAANAFDIVAPASAQELISRYSPDGVEQKDDIRQFVLHINSKELASSFKDISNSIDGSCQILRQIKDTSILTHDCRESCGKFLEVMADLSSACAIIRIKLSDIPPAIGEEAKERVAFQALSNALGLLKTDDLSRTFESAGNQIEKEKQGVALLIDQSLRQFEASTVA